MKLHRLALLATVALSAAACTEDAGPFLAPARSQAYVRWVNAVPDTFALNLRFVDRVEGSAWWEAQNFRYIGNYQGVDAGARQIKVFGSGTNINDVSQVFTDASVTFDAGKYYTLMSTGSARSGTVVFTLIEDVRATPGTQIAVKVINAGYGSAVDAYGVATATTAISGSPTIANVANLATSTYATLATGSVAFRVTSAGTTTILASALAPAGAAAASSSQSAQAGYSIAGSMLTAFVFPRSVAGSAAPQTTAFTSPAVIWMQDNRP
jgi:hypothetical protein